MEIVDLYDMYRNKLDKKQSKALKLTENEFLIIVHTVIFNEKNEMLIQKRGNDKIDFPNCWDISSGGGVKSGESSSQAAEREMMEELGIKINLEKTRPFMTIHFDKGFDDYYLLRLTKKELEFHIDNNEVLEIKWATKEEIKKMMLNGKFINYNDGFIDLLFSMIDNRGSYPKNEK